jgi:hypothetical protein
MSAGYDVDVDVDVDRAIDQRWMEDTPEEEAAWRFIENS